jgi:hypothetical protein
MRWFWFLFDAGFGAEDELRMAVLLKRGLQEQGYTVDVATTGPDVLWHAMEFAYGSPAGRGGRPGRGPGRRR